MASINNITDGAIKEILVKVKAALKGKSDTTHTHTKSEVGLGNVDNTADANKSVASAAKLTTARTIGISGAASSTAQSFNGTANVSIPITGVSEAYLTWGGKHLSGTTTLIDSAMCEEMSANRLSFMSPSGVTIEYSTDSGSTWTDYGASDAAKTELVTNTSGRTSFYMGKNATLSTSNRLRITISARAAGIYFKLRKALIYLSTNGSTVYVNVESSVIGTPTTFETLYSDVPVSGWSGWNSIALNGYSFGGGDTQTANTYAIRFTFYVTAVNTTYGNASISRIFMFGETMWSSSHSMQVSNRAYSVGNDKVATFAGNVVAPTFKGLLDGTATNATNDSEGQALTDYVKEISISDRTASMIITKGDGTARLLTICPLATTSTNGLMSSTDKSKLDTLDSTINTPNTLTSKLFKVVNTF